LLLPEGPFDPSFPQQRPLQNRRNTASNRKPRHYWKDIANIEHELREQWKSVLRLPSDENKGRSLENISRLLPNDQPPPIPNETLLTYWQRNDLANAIRNLGRPYLAYVLGGATVIPGRWKLAVQEPIVRCVVDLDENLTEDRSPPSRQQLDRMKERYAMSNKDIKKWAESGRWKRREGRRGKGFWSKEKVINLLYVLWDRREKQIMQLISETILNASILVVQKMFAATSTSMTGRYLKIFLQYGCLV
jgi:hypothetical protein